MVSGSEVLSNTSVGGYTFRLRDVGGTAQIILSPATGDATFNGNVTLASAPTSGSHATTKTYVDTEISGITAADLSLGNVDNTSDANKPISTATQTALDAKAPLASPTFTGVPAGPTATAGTSSTQLATTAFVQAAMVAGTNTIDDLGDVDTTTTPPTAGQVLKWNAADAEWQPADDTDTTLSFASAALTGTPTAPTAAASTNTTQIATTAFVQQELPVAADFDVDHLITLSGVAAASDDLGTFTGSTITDNSTIRTALQELETAVDNKQASAADLTILSSMQTGGATALATLTSTEIGILDGATVTTLELNILDGVTATTTELNYVDGVTSAIQTQIDGKVSAASPALTGTPTAPTAAASTNTTQIATTAFVQQELPVAADFDVDHLITLSGVAAASDDLGTFTGSTIADNETIKGALQDLETEVENKVSAASPALTGTPTAPTAAAAANDSQIATTAFVQQELPVAADFDVDHLITLSGVAAASDDLGTFTGTVIADNETIKGALQDLETELEDKADLASPALTGTPTAPTASQGTNTTQVATTAFVQAELTATLLRTALGIGEYADDTAAGVGGLTTGELFYNTTDSAYVLKS